MTRGCRTLVRQPPSDLIPPLGRVDRIAGTADRVRAVDVVDVAVMVVVEVIARHLTEVSPQVRLEVRMAVRDPAVDHGDHDGPGVGANVPRLRRMDVRLRRAAALPGVLQAPVHRGGRVVGSLSGWTIPFGTAYSTDGIAASSVSASPTGPDTFTRYTSLMAQHARAASRQQLRDPLCRGALLEAHQRLALGEWECDSTTARDAGARSEGALIQRGRRGLGCRAEREVSSRHAGRG